MGGRLQTLSLENNKIGSVLTPDKMAVKPARAAALLDCSRTKIYDAINAGELRAVRIAGLLRIPMSEIRRHLESAANRPHER